MNKQTRQDLKNLGLTAVVVGGLKRKSGLTGKPHQGVRAGEIGEFTATSVWKERNLEVGQHIVEVMTRNGYVVLPAARGRDDIITCQKGDDLVTFFCHPFQARERAVYWWILGVSK